MIDELIIEMENFLRNFAPLELKTIQTIINEGYVKGIPRSSMLSCSLLLSVLLLLLLTIPITELAERGNKLEIRPFSLRTLYNGIGLVLCFLPLLPFSYCLQTTKTKIMLLFQVLFKWQLLILTKVQKLQRN